MDFPQQIEETLVERPPSVYDVIMESPLYTTSERKMPTTLNKSSKQLPTVDKMNSSSTSILDDTTPSDSGIQMMDSESSSLMIESITSQNGFEFEALETKAEIGVAPIKEVFVEEAVRDTNSNLTHNVEDAMTASACSTFDTTESIVYRRKVPKSGAMSKPPKKRVSFHEDILKNTRTDNIHIEHGFITYKNGRKMVQQVGTAGRYSWCSEGDGASAAAPTELCDHTQDAEGAQGKQRRAVRVYRNACSDVLDYGNSKPYDTNEAPALQYDNSGVFEYLPQKMSARPPSVGAAADQADGQDLYRCSCSSSNSSLDSDENDKNCNRQQYGQAKSSSCDCIGMSNANNNLIGENCYYSEPNIDNLNETALKKSVWNKEKKPKSSCLKKTKWQNTVIHEQDLSRKMKKFNVHDMNQLLDNSSKMLFGSLKSIFTMPLPERGVPEGSEDLQAVQECVPELEQTPEHHAKVAEKIYTPDSPPLKAKPFLSKSLDGSKQQQNLKQFVHDVDEQLRRKKEEDMYAPTRQNSGNSGTGEHAGSTPPEPKVLRRQEEIDENQTQQQQFRNKFIINCESTVFEHTGVSYETNAFNEFSNSKEIEGNVAHLIETETPVAQPELPQIRSTFISTPIAKTFSSFFRSFKESATTPTAQAQRRLSETNKAREEKEKLQMQASENFLALKMQPNPTGTTSSVCDAPKSMPQKLSLTTSSSTISSDFTTSTNSLPPAPKSLTSTPNAAHSLAITQEMRHNLEKQSRHLPSPLKKRSSGSNLAQQPPRYGVAPAAADPNNLLSPDLFNGAYMLPRGGCGRDSKSTILSDEFDDILTITTDTDRNESDIVIVDYPEMTDRQTVSAMDYGNLLKPPPAKTSLINRFLRNVTQKKILETSIRQNNFFAGKIKNEQKLFSGNLYVPNVKPKNYDLIDDLNAEIAMEIEMSGANSPRRELISIDSDLQDDLSRFELGIGEISIDIFNGNCLHVLNDPAEHLMKVFKLYTGYSREGFMTPVLVFLTDKTLYVTDLVRNRLCSKFVLPYADLDVILMGPYGNTVLLSNSARDMQQVLLAGGPYTADALVANLELCARRSGSVLPAVGQLTIGHLAPLQAFVRENSSVTKEEAWMYYAVVNMPAGTLGSEQEPLGPHEKGFLMYRRIKEHSGNSKQSWNPGYFLLKAGVLYMFNDSSQKLPSWAMALAECQGARRAVKAGRPHCFEIMLKGQLLQLAAPDEYVASEWLQALLQSASGLFEMQTKHKTLGCTLIVTQNHLLTLREDFSTPLRQLNKNQSLIEDKLNAQGYDDNRNGDCNSLLSSTMSTPTKCTQRSGSSLNSTPTKMSRSTTTFNTHSKQFPLNEAEIQDSYSNMSSVYGKNCGVEILTCADIKEMTGIKIPSHNDTWWCILEFSCQEVRECTDDLVIFFASSNEMQRFLRLLEQLWQAKNNDLFPITVLDEDDVIAEQCTMLYMDVNRSWEPLLTAALGYPL